MNKRQKMTLQMSLVKRDRNDYYSFFSFSLLLTWVDWTRIIAEVEGVDWTEPVMLLDRLCLRWSGGGGGGNNKGILVNDEPLCPLETDAGEGQIDAIGDELKLEGEDNPLIELERLLEVEPVVLVTVSQVDSI